MNTALACSAGPSPCLPPTCVTLDKLCPLLWAVSTPCDKGVGPLWSLPVLESYMISHSFTSLMPLNFGTITLASNQFQRSITCGASQDSSRQLVTSCQRAQRAGTAAIIKPITIWFPHDLVTLKAQLDSVFSILSADLFKAQVPASP